MRQSYQHDYVHLAGPFSDVVMTVAQIKLLFSHLNALDADLNFELRAGISG
jgi:hypothetical protein